MQFVSNASCTTNCLAPVTKVLTTISGIIEGCDHYSSTRPPGRLSMDLSKKIGEADVLHQLIIPSSTGAAKAGTKVIPS